MRRKKTSIKGKFLRVVQLISGTILLLTCSIFFIYEYITYRQAHIRELTSIGNIIAANSVAALAFDDAEAAGEILGSLQAEGRITIACLYDEEGRLFASYPAGAVVDSLLGARQIAGYQFAGQRLEGYQPVYHDQVKLGTLFLGYSIDALYDRARVYALLTLVVIGLSTIFGTLLYNRMQRSISRPILALAETARAISMRQDFSVRAVRESDDEVGLFTDAFNQMLNRIQGQNNALTESSERLRAILNADLSGVIVMDADGRIIDWNKRAEKIFGWRKDEVAGGDMATLVIPERYREAHWRGFKRFLQTGEGPVVGTLLELSALRKDGSEFPVELSVNVLKTNDVLTFCGFVTDLTERKKAEEEIRAFNTRLEQMVIDRTAELEAANKELESFSYSISHDLRTPLRSIHGYVNILYEEYGPRLDDEAIRLINIVQENSRRMGRLIDDLLAFSRLGRRELSRSRISTQDMVESIIDEYRREEKGSGITFIVQRLPPLDADPATIRQVWENLIANAVKYSGNREKPVIEVGAVEEAGQTVYYVKDNGAGFSMDYYDKLFGVFQRLHSDSEFEGTGVGLAIVHRIISKHNGRIWAKSAPDEGATFFFSLESDGAGAAPPAKESNIT